MAFDFEPLLKWVWAPFVALGGGSIEWRLRNKVSKDTCQALHGGLEKKVSEMKVELKETFNQRFDDHEKFYSKQIDRVIREVKKNNNGNG